MTSRITFIVFITSFALVGCGGPAKRNKWQKQEDFTNHRTIYYNDFVESGGMIKDESSDQINPLKKEIQNALNQGRVINHTN